MENIYTLIANLGFPIGVSLYLLVRVEGRIECLTNSINELAKAVERI